MCQICGDGIRVEATELATGDVKAVLHPVSMDFEQAFSKSSQGSITLATGDVTLPDVRAQKTGVYISRVFSDGSRECLFASYVQADAIPSSPETVTIGLVSIDEYPDHRYMANEDAGIGYTVTGRQQTLIGKDYVDMMQWGGIPLSAIADPSTQLRDVMWKASQLKNIGQAIEELVDGINGVRYRLEHEYVQPGRWVSVMRFSDQSEVDRNIILTSDVDGLDCGISVDGKDHATRAYAVGAGEEDQQLLSVAYDAASIYPEFQATPAWKDVTIPETLENYARGYVASYRDPITTPAMSLAGLFPEPADLQVGDTVTARIFAKSFTFDGKAQVISIGWRIAADEAIKRVLVLLPKERPAFSIFATTVVPVVTPPAAPTPTGDDGLLQEGLVCNIQDSRVNEASCMSYSRTIPALVWVSNDENNGPVQMKGVSLSDGLTVSTLGFNGVSFGDPESSAIDPLDGRLYLGDIGDNKNSRTNIHLTSVIEPTTIGDHGNLPCKNYPIAYPFGPRNAETLMIHPVTGDFYIVTKQSGGRVVKFDRATLLANEGVLTTGTDLGVTVANLVSDGCFTLSGKYALLRSAKTSDTLVFNSTTWTLVDKIPSPTVSKGESITMEPGGKQFLFGSEGKKSPIIRVTLPEVYR